MPFLLPATGKTTAVLIKKYFDYLVDPIAKVNSIL